MRKQTFGIFIAICGTILVGTIAGLWVTCGWQLGVFGCCLAVMSAGVTTLVARLLHKIEKDRWG